MMGRALIEGLLFAMCLLVSSSKGNRGEPCESYGCPYRPRYEPFVPAPPGQTPRCAKPGQTFCESPEHYPQLLIKFLVDKCSYDFATVLRDETYYDFNSQRSKPEYHNGYEYPRQRVPQFYPQALPVTTATTLPEYPHHQGRPAIVYGPPSNDTDHQGYNYDTAVRSQQKHFLPDSTSPTFHNSQQNFINFHDAAALKNHQIDHEIRGQGLWPNRYTRAPDSSKVPLRSRRENPLTTYLVDSKRILNKRQASSPDTISVCPTNSQYITPRAALNSQGNWMYVVNLPETREKYSQLVRSETCVTSTCSGLCAVPDGYTSRCKQKYVQKRLVALEGTGDRLYTDVFWFPHGCMCEISLNY